MIGGALGAGAGGLIGDQLQGRDIQGNAQDQAIQRNDQEIQRQRQELEQLKQRREY
jgi:hypothetical protein